jgi:hypothetical protein
MSIASPLDMHELAFQAAICLSFKTPLYLLLLSFPSSIDSLLCTSCQNENTKSFRMHRKSGSSGSNLGEGKFRVRTDGPVSSLKRLIYL